MKTLELKDTLMAYKDNEYKLDDTIDLSELTQSMMREIGNLDSVLRDELIYSSFSQMILQGLYADKELENLLNQCLDYEHLFYEIGKTGDDSVFTRSFSLLIIAVILHVNLQKNFLSSADIEKVCQSLLKYLDAEQDTRGLVPGRGWAHSIAHVADALDELVKQPKLLPEKLEEIYSAILNKITISIECFTFDEDERLAIPVVSLLQKGLSEKIICEEIVSLGLEVKENSTAGDRSYFVYRANVKHFLSSLYFHLLAKEQNINVRKSIKQALMEFNQPFYQL
ncbi:DUF2785 domain-containing protein [Virgibacillus flavescens]|uniref:DUF2785 domain-containing protein n=1 Tax=Virgibacillus flavescens TaxID=1611422 RepID=UPI003D350266